MNDDLLQQLLSRLTEDADLLFASEDATKQGVILPILARLGWDRDNVREVVPEYRVETGRVDYCLRVGHKNRVFIEAKRTDQELEKHQEQLLDYAFREGVELGILTNGILWWLYLPLLEGSWEQRKFFTIDIVQQGPESAAKHFRRYLAKEIVESGKAVQEAKQLYRSREKKRLASTTLPEAWRLLREEPDELLVELIAEKVESLCGHRPPPEIVAQFLQGATPTQTRSVPERTKSKHGAKQIRTRSSRSQSRSARGFTNTRPTAFTLFGETRQASNFKEVLVGVCEVIAAKHEEAFDEVFQLKGRTREYFSRDSRGMASPAEIPGTDIYVETNLSSNGCVRRCEQVLRLFGYDEGSLQVHAQ